MNEPMLRQNDGWVQPLERPILHWFADRMPLGVTPDRLTLIGLFGAVLYVATYALAAWDPVWLWGASAGLFINWFGDSLDGTLARHRNIERPRYGYFLDNSIDVVEQFLLAVGFGLSGFFRYDVAFLALSIFLMLSVVTLLRVRVAGVYKLAYGGIGLTELRIAVVLLNTLIFFYPPERLDWLGLPMTYPNVLLVAWSCGALTLFSVNTISLIRELAVEDSPR